MHVNAYLTFDGNCRAAFSYYEKVLGGTIVAMLPHKGSPMEGHCPPEWQDKIMHARMTIGDTVLMASDAPPEHQAPRKGFSVNINAATAAEADRVFSALAEGGTVQMPIQETFWAHRFGMLVDRFGTPWMVNCEKSA
jgi:PhnB protein